MIINLVDILALWYGFSKASAPLANFKFLHMRTLQVPHLFARFPEFPVRSSRAAQHQSSITILQLMLFLTTNIL